MAPADTVRIIEIPHHRNTMQLVKIARANSGIDVIDALAGQTVTVLATGIDSDLEPWLEVWADQPTVLVYEDDLELISMT